VLSPRSNEEEGEAAFLDCLFIPFEALDLLLSAMNVPGFALIQDRYVTKAA
jgi:hypothetical protein